MEWMYPNEETSDARLKTINELISYLTKEREKLDCNIRLLEEEKKLIEQLNRVRQLEKDKSN